MDFFERLKQERSVVSHAAQRVDNEQELMMSTETIIEQLKRKIKQR